MYDSDFFVVLFIVQRTDKISSFKKSVNKLGKYSQPYYKVTYFQWQFGTNCWLCFLDNSQTNARLWQPKKVAEQRGYEQGLENGSG